jgi:hypothetical protein
VNGTRFAGSGLGGTSMRIVKIFAGAAALVCFALVPAYSAQRGNAGNHGPSTSTKAPSTTTHGPSTTKQGPSTTSHGPTKTTTKATGAPVAKGPSAKPTTKPVKTTETKVAKTDHVKAATTDATSVKSKKTGTATTTTADSTSTGTSTTGTTTTGTTATGTTKTTINFSTTPLGQKLSKNTALSSKLQTRLEALGYKGTVAQAAYGFKNLGQFVAATNVSRNLGVSFEQMKLNMTGLSVKPDGTVLQANTTTTGMKMVDPSMVTTPVATKSLGQSIQTVKAGVDSTAAAQTATTQANTEIQSTSTTPTTSTTTSTTPTTSTSSTTSTTSSPTSSMTTSKKSSKKAS